MEVDSEAANQQPPKTAKKSKKKTQILFEQYKTIANAIATYLRSRESEAERVEGEGEVDYLPALG
jgi:hypothetical protein